MRIIAGNHRGHKLKSVPGKNTRPTTDKVKESVFNIIGPYFSEGICLDLFAGSGSLGLEAISRGINHSVFIERNGLAVTTINENIARLKVEDKTEVLRMDALKGLNYLTSEVITFNLIFIDPPYKFKNIFTYIDNIVQSNLLATGGIIVCEHESAIKIPDHESLSKVREAIYGTTAITIFKKD